MADDPSTAAPKLVATATLNPDHAAIAYDSGGPLVLNEDDWAALSNDLQQTITAGLSQYQELHETAEDSRRIYEMEVIEPRMLPWENASNVDVPIIPTLVDTAVAQIAAMALPPRLIIVTGTTPESTKNAPLVERYLNDQLVQQRGHTTWYNELVRWLELGILYGTGYVSALWRKEKRTKQVRIEQLKTDPENPDTPIIDPETMEPERETVVHTVVETLYDDIDLQSIKLKDFMNMPPTAKTIESAVANCWALWPMEDELQKMVEEGTLDSAEVEAALAYVPHGNDEVSSDRQGYGDKTAGGELSVGSGQGSQTSRFFVNRGPIKVWLILSNQYNLRARGIPLEGKVPNNTRAQLTWFWYHERSQRMLGFADYEYMPPGISGTAKPFFSFSPLPRFDEHIGFMLPIRLAPIRAEINNIHNSGNNLLDLAQNPLRTVISGSVIEDNGGQFGPGFSIEVDRHDAMQFMQMPQPPIEAFQREGQLIEYANQYAGIGQQATGIQGKGRRTAADTKAQVAGGNIRSNLIAMRYRIEIRALVNFILKMKVQFMESDGKITIHGEDFPVTRDILGMPYRVDIVGASDPTDAATRRQEVLALYQLLMTNPIVQQSPMKIYAISRMVLEAFNEGDVTELLGTEEEAQQMEQMKQQMAQAQAQQLQQQQAQKQGAQGMAQAQAPAPAGGDHQQAPPPA